MPNPISSSTYGFLRRHKEREGGKAPARMGVICLEPRPLAGEGAVGYTLNLRLQQEDGLEA